MAQHPFRGRHQGEPLPSGPRPDLQPDLPLPDEASQEDEVLRALLQRLQQPALDIQEEPRPGPGSAFTQAVAAATNPQGVAAQLLKADVAGRQGSGLKRAQLEGSAEGRKNQSIQNLLNFLGLQADRKARRDAAEAEAARKRDADADKRFAQEQKHELGLTKLEDRRTEVQDIFAIRTSDQGIQILIEQIRAAQKHTDKVQKRIEAQIFIARPFNDAEMKLIDVADDRSEKLLAKLAVERRRLGLEPAADPEDGGEDPATATPAAPGGPSSVRERFGLDQ